VYFHFNSDVIFVCKYAVIFAGRPCWCWREVQSLYIIIVISFHWYSSFFWAFSALFRLRLSSLFLCWLLSFYTSNIPFIWVYLHATVTSRLWNFCILIVSNSDQVIYPLCLMFEYLLLWLMGSWCREFDYCWPSSLHAVWSRFSQPSAPCRVR